MLIGLGVILLIIWILSKFVWHVASMGIHVLLAGAIVLAIMHFVKGSTRRKL